MGQPSQEVLDALPHREPFLFIDEIVHCDDEKIEAKLELTGKEDFFRGHYPHRPITPGVLLCEMVFQAGAIYLARKMGSEEASSGTPVVTRINNVRFRSPVEPGDLLDIQASLVEVVSGVFFMKGRILRQGKRVVDVEFACTLMEAP